MKNYKGFQELNEVELKNTNGGGFIAIATGILAGKLVWTVAKKTYNNTLGKKCYN